MEKVELEQFDDSVQQQNESETVYEKQGSTKQEELENCQLARDRAQRQIKTPARFALAEVAYFALNATMNIESQYPSSYKEAVTYLDKNTW